LIFFLRFILDIQNISNIFYYYYSVTFLNASLDSLFMVVIRDAKLKAFCEPVLDVQYLYTAGCSRLKLSSKKQYYDLALLYFKSLEENGSYIVFSDDDGIRSASLTPEGIRYARSNELFLFPRKRLIDSKKIHCDEFDHIIDKDSLKEDYFTPKVTADYESHNSLGKSSDVNATLETNCHTKMVFYGSIDDKTLLN